METPQEIDEMVTHSALNARMEVERAERDLEEKLAPVLRRRARIIRKKSRPNKSEAAGRAS